MKNSIDLCFFWCKRLWNLLWNWAKIKLADFFWFFQFFYWRFEIILYKFNFCAPKIIFISTDQSILEPIHGAFDYISYRFQWPIHWWLRKCMISSWVCVGLAVVVVPCGAGAAELICTKNKKIATTNKKILNFILKRCLKLVLMNFLCVSQYQIVNWCSWTPVL